MIIKGRIDHIGIKQVSPDIIDKGVLRYTLDIAKIGAQGQQDRENIKTQGSEDREGMREANRLEAKTRASQSKYARGLAGMF